jgi:hypothetical protein
MCLLRATYLGDGGDGVTPPDNGDDDALEKGVSSAM